MKPVTAPQARKPNPRPSPFGGKPDSGLTVGNDYIKTNMYKADVAIVDARGIAQEEGAERAGVDAAEKRQHAGQNRGNDLQHRPTGRQHLLHVPLSRL